KKDIREYVHERAWVKRGDWASVGKASVVGKDPERVHTALRTPDDLLVVSAGGPAGGFGAIIPPGLGAKSLAVTMRIEEKPGESESSTPESIPSSSRSPSHRPPCWRARRSACSTMRR